jgi:hypothetical protein
MTPIGSAVISAGLRRLVAATLFMAAALGVLGHPAIARAEWDIEEYDRCMATPSNTWHHAYDCCVISGGQWNSTGNCVAPVELQGPDQGGTTPTTLRPVMTPVMPPPTEALP